jgi:3-hydroxyacyl-CoA dehydrogenase/enoyl-CoA hydratase/3-hydroxybutyryl-CoA epimerase
MPQYPSMNSPIRYELGADRVVTVTFDAPGAPVNTMTEAWIRAFHEMLDRLEAERENYDGVILASAKKTFFAGAELKDVLQFKPTDGPRVFEWLQAVKRDLRRLEKLGKPVVACLAGTALGGGFEIALSCHCRICVDDPRIQLGQPEVSIGLLPAAGGTTKFVRLLGLQAAFPYLVEGRLMTPAEAAQLGLLQGLAVNLDGLFSMAREWIRANPAPVQPWDEKNYRIPGGTPSSPKVAQMLAIAPAMLVDKTRGLYPAPAAILAAMVEGAEVDFDTALRIESRHFARLAVGQVAKNMITAFHFNLSAIRSGASRPKGVPRWRPAKVGVLGAGMMGAGIAWACASRGLDCALADVSAEKAAAGKAVSETLAAGRVKRGRMDEREAATLLERITPTASYDALAGSDVIIEAVFEQRALKAQVTRQAEPKLAAGGIFASNTSTLPITGLAEASARPERFVGLHFFSPVDKMRLVEIIKGAKTSPETLAKAYDLVLAIGKTPIVVNDARGFFTSRTFGTYVMEGCTMLEEGIPAAVIENAARLAGMPVGPLAVIDETSLSLSVHVMEQTEADLRAEGKAAVAPPGQQVIVRMVKEFKRPGRAAGAGFYDYPQGGRKRLWPELARIFGKPGARYDLDTLKDRFLYRQAIETARCLEEGVLETVHDANIGSIFGIGFPAWTGGAAQFINHVGAKAFAERADALANACGERFTPPAIVREKAQRGEAFV